MRSYASPVSMGCMGGQPNRPVNPLSVDRAKGVYFWTVDGQRFLDFNSQLMCVNIGHGDERVITAIREQAEKLTYAMPLMATEP